MIPFLLFLICFGCNGSNDSVNFDEPNWVNTKMETDNGNNGIIDRVRIFS